MLRKLVAATTLLLAACTGGTATTSSSGGSTPSRNLGLMQIEINNIGSSQMSSKASMISDSGSTQNDAKSASLTDVANGLDIQQVSTRTVDIGTPGNGTRYISVFYKVRNARNCVTPGSCAAYGSASHNLTFLAANTPTGLNGTAIGAMNLFDGTSAANQATTLLPTHGMDFDTGVGSGVLVDPNLTSLQIFSEAELSSFSGPLTGINYLLPYGFVVRNINSTSSRSLPGNPAVGQYDGLIAFSFKLPLNSVNSQNPFSVILTFDVLDDSNTRVTQSAEEQNNKGDIAAAVRAAMLSSTDLAVMGGRVAQSNVGNPICSVRTAGAVGAATAYLVNNSANAVGSAPYNLQFLAANSKLNFGFCTPMVAATASTIILIGSQSGRRVSTFSKNVSGNILSFTPTSAYFPGEQVSYSLTTKLKSSGGTALGQSFVGSFIAANLAGVTHGAGTFAAQHSYGVGSAPISVVVGDLDGDGAIDLAATNTSDSTVSVLLGHGDGTFATQVVYDAGAGSGTYKIAAGDFNGDGAIDLVTTGLNNNAISVLLNNGDGTFAPPVAYGVGSLPFGVAVSDFNGDGKMDLVTANGSSNNVSVLLGNGDGTFVVQMTTYNVGSQPRAVVVGDFNGDGKMDLLTANANSNNISVLLGKGDGTFAAQTVVVGLGSSPSGLAVGDFNGDSKIDFAVTNAGSNNISVFLGNGDGTFVLQQPLSTVGSLAGEVAAGDFNGDGKIDLTVTNRGDDTVVVSLGNGNGTFAVPVTYNVGSSPNGIAVGDFDGNRKIDLVTSNTDDNGVSVLLGQ